MAPKKRAVGIMDNDPSHHPLSGKTWFLGIGINAYQNWPPLQNVVHAYLAYFRFLLFG